MDSTDPPPDDSKAIDEVYHDRNLLAIVFARATRFSWGSDTAGWYWHKDWWVDTPAGQKSWHVTPDLEDVLDQHHDERTEREKMNGRREFLEGVQPMIDSIPRMRSTIASAGTRTVPSPGESTSSRRFARSVAHQPNITTPAGLLNRNKGYTIVE